MTKKILAAFVALTMIFSMCGAISFAEGTSQTDDETVLFAEGAEDTSEPAADDDEPNEPATKPTEAPEPDDEEKDAIYLTLSGSFTQGSAITVSGEITGNIQVVQIDITSREDSVFDSKMMNASEFVKTGYKYSLSKASAGVDYTVRVSNYVDPSVYDEDSFTVKKGSGNTSSDNKPGDGRGTVTIWIDSMSDRYVDKQTISLEQVGGTPTVLSVAEYLLEEVVERRYRLNTAGDKIDRIATTPTGSVYLRDNSYTSAALKDAQWCYFLNGRNYPESMAERNVKDGDEIVIYYGVPGVTGYPIVNISPSGGLSLNDYLEISVENQITDPDTYEVTSKPVSGARVYLFKRNAKTSSSSAGRTDSKGLYRSSKITTSFLSSYQGGKVRVAYYQTSSTTAPQMVSKDFDLVSERYGYVQATLSIEGAYRTLLKPYKPAASTKLEEYNLYDYTCEVLNLSGVNIEYEVNSARNNFTYFESSPTRGYYNSNGDITRDSAWYVSVNGMVFGPGDNLRTVEVYTDDRIIYYFGDKNTTYAYYNVVDDLKSGERVRVYFYSDEEFSAPISGMTVYFIDNYDGTTTRYKTDSTGMIRLAAVQYKGTYTLEWGEHIQNGDDYVPEYVYQSVDLVYTGTTRNDNNNKKDDDDYKQPTVRPTTPTSSGKNPDDFEEWDEPTQKPTTKPTQPTEEDETWNSNDVTTNGKYPDTNPPIDAWAEEYVYKARDYNLMSGTGYGYFEPLRGITRSEFTTIIARLLALNTDAGNYNRVFEDVRPTDWHYGYIMAAFSAGFVTGKDAVTFAPDAYLTREEMAVLVSRIIGGSGNGDVSNYADSSYISSWAASGVSAVTQAGLMAGDQYGNFSPQGTVTREQAAIVAVRLYEYLGYLD